MAGASTFGITWWIADGPAGMESDNALTLAAFVAGTVLLPLIAWAGRPYTPHRDRGKPPSQRIVGAVPHEAVAFRGRAAILQELTQVFAGRENRLCALTGGPGVGKTQAAAAFARTCIEAGYPVVVWAGAQDRQGIITRLAELADDCGVRRPDTDSATAAADALRWLSTQPGPCLIVYDNATDPDLVAQWTPTVGQVRVLVTTTRGSFGNLGLTVAVDVFTEPEAVDYLLTRTGLADVQGARQIADELGCLPVALAQAASTIGRGRAHPTFALYAAQLRRVDIAGQLQHVPGDHYPRSTVHAFALALEDIKREDSTGLAMWLLSLLSVLSPAGVAVEMLTAAADRGVVAPVVPASETVDAQRVRTALALLGERSLLTFSQDGSQVIVHRLLQRVVREVALTNGTVDGVIAQVVTILDGLKIPRASAWTMRNEGKQLVAQIEVLWAVLAGIIGKQELVSPGTVARVVGLRVWAVDHLWYAHEPGRSMELGTLLAADAERILSNDHPETINARNFLAVAHAQAKRYDEAVALGEQNVTDYLRVLGEDHPDTLDAQNNLAMAYLNVDRAADALRMQEQILANYRRVKGDDDPDTLTGRNNLAVAYWHNGRFIESIALFWHNVRECHRIFGAEHPTTVEFTAALALHLDIAGFLADAIVLYEENATASAACLGENHDDAVTARADLVEAKAKAKKLSKRVKAMRRRWKENLATFGPDRFVTLRAQTELAIAYLNSGAPDKGVELAEDGFVRRRHLYGDDDPDTLLAWHLLGSAYRQAGRRAEAAATYERCVASHRQEFGDAHPLTMLAADQVQVLAAS
ncbi:tetratricopeptide repeat protein [Catellatospora sp. NPDC049133]|uniref:tetratricopeptide repeat protein n=1 Tax=Catellatospora sp. NPDC049133 TaxID=3155499 RepID=UPI0033F4DD31